MSNPNNQGDTKAPNFSKEYERGLKIYLKYLPKELQQELMYRQQYDPQFIEQAMGLQEKYDPRLAQEQLDALQRRDPQWLAVHGELGDKIKAALDRGYLDPRQEAAYGQYADLVGRYAAMAGKGEPTRDRAYQALGQQVTGDTLRGGTASPETLRQMTQAILSRQPGLSYGEAQNMAAAVYTGQRSEALKNQRQQATGQFLQTATPTSQREASLAQAGQSMGQFYGQAPPEQNVLGLAGTYIQPSNSITGMLNQIPGVQAPRAFGYVNPNAGYQGAQFGLQNYQNMLAQNQQQNSNNPWMGALSGAGSGAMAGSSFGPYGALIGAGVGAVGGYFSDERLKTNISRTQLETPDGIPIVEFNYIGSEKRWRGVIAQEVAKVRPDAVHDFGNGTLGVFYSKLGIELTEVHDAD